MMDNPYPDFENAQPQDILQWAAETYGDKLAVVTSFQPTGIVTLNMLQHIAPQIPVLTLDTGLLFPETYALIDKVEKFFDIQVIRIKPEQTVMEQTMTHGAALWEIEPALCCYRRKVLPLQKALLSYDAWITGLRRDQSPTRANIDIASWDKQHGLVKLSPFANWTEKMLWAYIEAYELPYNPLHDQNYPSIGCYTCTQAVLDGEDKRAGRWTGHSKTECGIHFGTITVEAEKV